MGTSIAPGLCLGLRRRGSKGQRATLRCSACEPSASDVPDTPAELEERVQVFNQLQASIQKVEQQVILVHGKPYVPLGVVSLPDPPSFTPFPAPA